MGWEGEQGTGVRSHADLRIDSFPGASCAWQDGDPVRLTVQIVSGSLATCRSVVSHQCGYACASSGDQNGRTFSRRLRTGRGGRPCAFCCGDVAGQIVRTVCRSLRDHRRTASPPCVSGCASGDGTASGSVWCSQGTDTRMAFAVPPSSTSRPVR